MSRDFLTPLVAATLFPDFAQRFIPYPIPRFDRARGLEATIAVAWSSVAEDSGAAQGNPFSKPYLAHWDPTGPAPALLLNTTDVNKGHRVAQAPFTLVDGLGSGESGLSSTFWLTLDNDFYSVTGLGGFETSRDISLASAVALSARFPWITPAGTFSDEQTFVRLVDGGYFENSGAEAAVDLLKRLAKPAYPDKNWPKIRVFLLMITAARSDPDDRSVWNGLGEILSPIRAFMNTRERRGNLAISRAVDDYNKNALVLLNLDDFALPLGWQLSAASQAVIGEHSGRADRQINTDGIADERAATLLLTLQENNDAACSVLTFLSPNYKPSGDACVRAAADGKRKVAR